MKRKRGKYKQIIKRNQVRDDSSINKTIKRISSKSDAYNGLQRLALLTEAVN